LKLNVFLVVLRPETSHTAFLGTHYPNHNHLKLVWWRFREKQWSYHTVMTLLSVTWKELWEGGDLECAFGMTGCTVEDAELVGRWLLPGPWFCQ
jgi:hypothetical protein